ncbi:hypothetical protein [Campylobacter rectus]|uniref:hypothetical protein n=1 Tax=Campylobacter rectus TaxID=203 RepID=UPI000F5D9A15|nr:hypothetical protein [Campylobacter rectus]RRD54861.1 hypothetical protein EII16_03870 [Campylobacter rectus]
MSVTFAICLVLLLGFFRAERYPFSLRNLPRIRKFLKLYSPNIQIFSDTSPFKQEIEFYASYNGFLGYFRRLRRHFLVCQSFILKTDERAQNAAKKMNSRRIIFGLSFGYFATMVYFTGYLVTDGIALFAKDFTVTFESKFETF